MGYMCSENRSKCECLLWEAVGKQTSQGDWDGVVPGEGWEGARESGRTLFKGRKDQRGQPWLRIQQMRPVKYPKI